MKFLGEKYNGKVHNSIVDKNYFENWEIDDVCGVLLNVEEKTLTFYCNKTSLGVAFKNLTGTNFYPAIQICHRNSFMKYEFYDEIPKNLLN